MEKINSRFNLIALAWIVALCFFTSCKVHSLAADGDEDIFAEVSEEEREINVDIGNLPNNKKALKQLIIQAVQNDNYDLVCSIINEKGGDVDSKDRQGKTLLYWAVFRDNTEIAKFLIEKGANVNKKDKQKKSPLHLAASDNKLEMLDLLLKSEEINVDSKDNTKRTPLHLAAMGGGKDVVTALIEVGANLESKDTNGETPLHLAARSSEVTIIDLLLEKGANVNSRAKRKVERRAERPYERRYRPTPLDVSTGTEAQNALIKMGGKEGTNDCLNASLRYTAKVAKKTCLCVLSAFICCCEMFDGMGKS